MILILLGAPGSGKGTQGRRLSEHFHVPYMASGDLFRRLIDQGNPLGEQVGQYVERGLYVPDDVTVPAVMEELENLRQEWDTFGVVLDGFPRTRGQAESLDEALRSDGKRVERVLFLAVPKDVLVDRLAGRWTCRSCGATYNVATHAPNTPGVCDRCGHSLVQRVDDGPEMVERRLNVYLESTVPLVAYYRSKGRLVEIDGNRLERDVTAALIAAAEGRK